MATKETKNGIEGWLRRKGSRPLNSWSRRWCVLSGKILCVYVREDDRKWQEMVALDKQIIVERPPDNADPRHGYFSIVSEDEKSSSESLHLCAETEAEKKQWMHALKRALYADKGGALFSQPLEEIVFQEKKEGRRIPYIVDECVEYLYKYGLDVEGIFRLPGRQASIKDVMARFEQGKKIKFEDEETDVHVVASVLKTFLRELPDSIIPCRFYQKFMNFALRFMDCQDEEKKEVCVEELAEAMKLIPQDNYVILKYICTFLHEVGQHEEKNKMSLMNLGTLFGYNLIRHIDKENSQLFLCTADLSQNLVYMLLNYYPKVFRLEYSESTAVEQVPTADLLRMSKFINNPPISPSLHSPTSSSVSSSLMADLEGIDFTMSTSGSDRDSVNSPVPNNTLPQGRDDSKEDDNVFTDKRVNTAQKANRKTLHLSLSQPPGEQKSLLSPSPTTDPDECPVAPRRAKSTKLTRNYRSERRRPEGINVRDKAPRSPMGPELNSEDVLTALARANISCPNSPRASPLLRQKSEQTSNHHDAPVPSPRKSRTLDRNLRINDIQEKSQDTSGPSYDELKAEVDRLKQDMVSQREKFRERVSAMKSQMSDMREKYERRIETMLVESNSQIQELQSKLASERDACAAAVANTIKLQDELHKYQLKYGELQN